MMRIDRTDTAQIPQLLQLWKTAFGDHGGFWELFLDTAFEENHCRCIAEDGQVLAALYWFDCTCHGQPQAYIYGVVTHPEHRKKGLCRTLLADVHNHLAASGYTAALLLPEQPGLRDFYRKLGYTDCTAIAEFSCEAADAPVPFRAIGPEEYRQLRRILLPQGGVLQEGTSLDFLACQAQFYAGADFLLAAYAEETQLFGLELLGNRSAAPGILNGLSLEKGSFRTPGDEKPFAMYYPLSENAAKPTYFAFPFD